MRSMKNKIDKNWKCCLLLPDDYRTSLEINRLVRV